MANSDMRSMAAKGLLVRQEKAKRRDADLRPIFAEIQAAGIVSLRGIAAALNARGIRTARGCAWTAAEVKRVLDRSA